MTEIPEHLLKRSKERRAAIGGEATPPATRAPLPGDAPRRRQRRRGRRRAARGRRRRGRRRGRAPPPPEPVRPEVAAAPRAAQDPVLGDARARRSSRSGPTCTRPPSSRRPPARDDPLVLGEEVYGRLRQLPRRRPAAAAPAPRSTGVLETWPDYRRPHRCGCGSARSRLARATPTAPTTSPRRGGMPGHAAPHRRGARRRSSSTSASTFGGLDPTQRGVRSRSSRSPRATSTFAEAGLGDGLDGRRRRPKPSSRPADPDAGRRTARARQTDR